MSTIAIRFAEGHRYHGAEARVRGMSFGEWEAASGLDGGEGDNTATTTKFVERLVSWNLDDETGKAIPATPEGMRQADQGLIRAMAEAWIQALVGVHDADPLPESSPSGEPSLVESVPMEALSPSLAS
ncbi:hypothetical protein ACWDG1_09155 [Streptomyces sp. NPDC001177]